VELWDCGVGRYQLVLLQVVSDECVRPSADILSSSSHELDLRKSVKNEN